MKLNQILPLFTVIIFIGIAIRVLRGPSTPEVARTEMWDYWDEYRRFRDD